MKNILLPFVILIAFSSCEQITPIEKTTANVEQSINGLYIFIKSRPIKAHDIYEKPINRNAAQDIVDSGKKKGFWNVLGGLAEGVAKNVTFNDQVNAMSELTKEIYPDADGVIFSNSLNECKAFKFRE